MQKLKWIVFTTLLILTSLWVLLFIWVHQPHSATLSYGLMFLWLCFAAIIFYLARFQRHLRYSASVSYLFFFCVVLLCFFSMEPRNDRTWRAENRELLNFEFVEGEVEIKNVRNFIWTTEDDYEVQWETRRYRIDEIKSIDLIVSHFIPGPVAHAFVSFGFEDGRYISLSLEVRQEVGEGFSTLGGFFRQYELALVGGDENDLIFSRTNIREEDLYIYPLQMDKIEMQMLFLEYLNKANRLTHKPRWYNTLISNCTTILFDLTEHAIGSVDRDYRVFLPGLLPHYLYDHGQLDQTLSLEQWRERAYVNPKTKHLTTGSATENIDFSALIRTDMPKASMSEVKEE